MSSIKVMSTRAPEPGAAYAHAVISGGLVFVSGVDPRRKGSAVIPGVVQDGEGNVLSYDFALQCKAAFQNLKFILEDAGSSFDKLLDVTVYLKSFKRDAKAFEMLWTEICGSIQPTRTVVEVSQFRFPIAIELKAIARS
ncbi:RidA family protein [bacterium]|nr:RidA family protein [bacterium]